MIYSQHGQYISSAPNFIATFINATYVTSYIWLSYAFAATGSLAIILFAAKWERISR